MDIGIFGGTFDPPHIGHLVVAQDAMEALGLDEVRFVPARRSPFKAEGEASTPAELRAEMVQRAIAGRPGFALDGLELERPGPSYSVDTVRALRQKAPSVTWTLLLGADQWRSFGSWKEADELARLARIAVLTRGGDGAPVGPDLPHREVRVTRLDVSSTDVRRRVREGHAIRYLVPDPVRAIIEANGLYTTC